MSEQVMVLGKGNKGISKTSSVHPYESPWLGRWTQMGNEVKFHDQSDGVESKCCKVLIRPEDGNVKKNHGVEVLPFPMFKVSHKKESTKPKLQASTKQSFYEDVGSSSKSMANRMPWMYPQGEKYSPDFPIQEKTTQNLLELIRPVRIYATVDSVNLPEEDGHQLFKGSTVSMKLKGKIVGGYLDLFPNLDHCHNKGGARLESLESSKNTEEEDGPRNNESSAETDILEMDKLQTIHLSGSISSSTKVRKDDSGIPRNEIPDMNEEPPLVLDRENSVEGYQGETSNSATQSMNAEHFLFRECKRVRLETEAEPSSRWVKRLKTNASDSSGHDETKSLMNIKEASPGQKGNNNLFLEIMKSGINNLQPRNQEPVISQIKNLNQGVGEEDITLLHPWIQRWCKKKATLTDQLGGQEASFEPENQKEIEKKHFPSIAAMALMGKALSGLNPYALRKTDSLMVWNARDLR
ncbi:PREDICTED: F-box protein At2g16365-like isoform X2 [Camelina sativa]|nr:PREDICTED: F-box protein At2g16365-like isoform X2 [Camelina sativa]XP_010467359.1 PREDICTED: F-box protein At2g16365-like isoform X2 [Camelina sativa]